ncbi:hypothetical protein TNIN_303631 [Trichonephila inaurata madagascariensis]|uniref:Uncharacterized protein n=1 Tax=Trichonephila inaurata madagascariensis TaxID=2747483 RepID=A0A8X6MB81_9ARAC|nr:hypothetical protein TNIN_303631 [Trichonephila inaurata madagascariensis]
MCGICDLSRAAQRAYRERNNFESFDGFAGSQVRWLGKIQQLFYALGHHTKSGWHFSKTCGKHGYRGLSEHGLR